MTVRLRAMTVRLLNRESDASIFPEPLLLRFNPRQEIKGDLCNFLGKKKSSVCIRCFPEKYTVYPRSFEKQKPVFRRTWNLCCLCQRLLERRVHERVNKTETHFWKPCSTALLVVRNSTCGFVTLNFKLFFLDFSLFGVAVQLHSNFFFHILCTKQTQTNTLEITGNTSACDHTVKSSDFVNYDYLKITQSNTLIILSCLNFLARAT